MSSSRSIRARIEAHAPGSLIPREAVLALFEDAGEDVESVSTPEPEPAPEPTWRALLWTVPAETRLGVNELSEALGRSRDWIYRQVSAWKKSGHEKVEKAPGERLPHRRLSGELVFTAGEIRTWIRTNEEVEHACELESIRHRVFRPP